MKDIPVFSCPDDIATLIKAMGYNTCVTEGAKHILGWKSPNYVYAAATEPIPSHQVR